MPSSPNPAPKNTGGWLIISDASVSGGSVSAKVYQDSGNTVLRSCTASSASVILTVKASYPKILVNGVSATLTNSADGGHYSGTVATTVTTTNVPVEVVLPDGGQGGYANSIAITVNAPPVILTLAFVGSYPGSQTELKVGDTFQIQGTTDKLSTGIQILDFEACQAATITFSSATSFTVTGTIADRGTTVQSLHARLQAKDSTGAYGPTHDTSNTVACNNLFPSVSFGTITYPATQSALKNSETATVVVTSSNLDTILFDSPNSQLSITAPTTIGSPKTVTRIAGSYNVSVNNLRAVATRTANAATNTAQGIVQIANVAPVLTVTTPAARLRSGGNDGTSQQNHTITCTADQNLAAAPSISAGASGTFTGSWSGSGAVYTRTMQVHDNDTKGTFTFTSILATGLAGLTVTSIATGSTYVLGGFVSRNLTFASFSQTTAMNVAVVTYAKLTAGIFTATNQPALLNASQGNHSNILNTYTVDTLSVNPSTIYWNDVAAASSNSGGTAQITSVQETV